MKRLLIAAPCALLITVFLFAFMAWMVDKGHQGVPKPSAAMSFNMLMVENSEHVARRKRALPPPPEKPQQAPQPPKNTVTPDVSPVVPASTMPNIKMDVAVAGVGVNVPALPAQPTQQLTQGSLDTAVMPLHRVEPRYPQRALQRRIQGYVVLQFNIDKNGNPVDIQVVDAKPQHVFEREAIRGLKRWKYRPKKVDGKTVAQIGQRTRIEFKIAN